MSGYNASIDTIAHQGLDYGIEDAVIDQLVTDHAEAFGVDRDTVAGEVEERITELRFQRDEERRHLGD